MIYIKIILILFLAHSTVVASLTRKEFEALPYPEQNQIVEKQEEWAKSLSEEEILDYLQVDRLRIERNQQWIVDYHHGTQKRAVLNQLVFFERLQQEAIEEIIRWLPIWEPHYVSDLAVPHPRFIGAWSLLMMKYNGWDIQDRLLDEFNKTNLDSLKFLIAYTLAYPRMEDAPKEMLDILSQIDLLNDYRLDAFGNYWGLGNSESMVMTAEEYQKQKDSYKSASTSNKASQEDMQNQIYEHQNTFLTTQEDNRSFIKMLWIPMALGLIAIAVFILYRALKRPEV